MLRVEKILFKNDRVEIEILDETHLTSEARLKFSSLVAENYPQILMQDCRNSHGSKFGDCLKTTSLAHVLEHVIICNMQGTAADFKLFKDTGDKAGCDPSVSPSSSHITRSLIFVGKTTKMGPNLAKIELKYYDDIHALGAIKRSIEDVNEMLNACLD
ncbi:MAG: hypothetical protein Q3982_06045 [Phoenicibacter congonensis]|uniref:Cyanophycin synthase-like N-terminal domain-containing protein n=1 Tax=Phoenicibacter congonensis TaxID=1944646 RepID=A0AA43RME6_9ACTN|nr:hypothetical protein [Phoenicibacter congonensis]